MEVTPPAVSQTAGNIKYYHIVVASLPTMSQADKYISRMDRHQYTQAGIVERDGKSGFTLPDLQKESRPNNTCPA